VETVARQGQDLEGWKAQMENRGSEAEGKGTQELKALGYLTRDRGGMEDEYLHKLHPVDGGGGSKREGSLRGKCLRSGDRSSSPTGVYDRCHQPHIRSPSSHAQ
jgi:hypothetical protein